MLTQLRLRNFRCFSDHVLPLRERTIIVGRNNAGKSTVVESLRLVALVANRYGNLIVQPVPSWLDAPRIFKGVSPSLTGYAFNSETLFHRYGDPPAQITADFDSGDKVEIYVGADVHIHAVVFDADGIVVTGRSATERARLARVRILPQVGPLPRSERILDADYVRGSMDSPVSTLHFRNQILLHPEYVAEFEAIAEETWPGLRVNGLLEDDGQVRNPLQLMIRDGSFVAEVALMGHGLQMWLQTMWFLAQAKDSPTVILDEPDVYMHADLQRRLIRFLKTRHNQTVIATHSIEMMAEVEPDEVLVVDKGRKRSQFANSLPAVQEVINRIGGVHNMQLARLWNSRRCLLIEGDDVAYLRVFHSTLFPSAPEALDAMPRVPIGGWTGFKYAIGSRMLLKNAGGEAIIPYCVLDRDYHTDDEIAERYAAAKTNGVELHIWKRKEIENYLVSAEAIQRVIAAFSEKPPTTSEIRAQLDRIAGELREETTDKIASELYNAHRASGIASANSRARELVNTAWRREETRWGICSGKAILSGLSRWTQGTYGKGLSPSGIARVIRRDELASEVQQVLGAIESTERFPSQIRPATNPLMHTGSSVEPSSDQSSRDSFRV